MHILIGSINWVSPIIKMYGYATQMLPHVNAHLEEAKNLLEYVRKQFDFRPEQGLDYSH